MKDLAATLSLLVLAMAVGIREGSASEGMQSPSMTWMRSASTEGSSHPTAIALLIHGLNLRPDWMRDVGTLLNAGGADALLVGLSGHNGEEAGLAGVTREKWLDEAYQAYCVAREAADASGLPLYFVGFSLGGAIGLELLAENFPIPVAFDRMILLAPAAAPQGALRAVLLFGLFGQDFLVPSLSIRSYRANQGGTTVGAYTALFEMVRAIEGSELSKLNIPTLWFIDPEDELVSEDGLKALIRAGSLDRWSLVELSHEGVRPRSGYHHIILNEESLGSVSWQRMSEEIAAFMVKP
ncbi:MAG: alpha/beta fold hydrolase [Spirochaetota bacterium]